MKSYAFILIMTAFLSAQVVSLNDLNQVFMDIRTDIAQNQKNLTLQLKAGKNGIKSLEQFVIKRSFTDYNTLKRWLDIYFATTQYVLDDPKPRNRFLNSLINGKKIPASFRTQFTKDVNDLIEKDRIEREFAAKFEIGKRFPGLPNGTKDMNGRVIRLSDYKGKLVLVDFWATWCKPCIQELPNVKAVYRKYKSKGFDILGISFDGPNRSMVESFIARESMSWRHIYDGGGWQSKLSDYYNIKAIPMTFLLKDGVIIAKNLRGYQLEQKVSEILN